LIAKKAFFAYVNHARIHTWNQQVISNEGEGIHRLRVRGTTHFTTSPLEWLWKLHQC